MGYITGGQRFMAVVNKPRLWAMPLDSVCLLTTSSTNKDRERVIMW